MQHAIARKVVNPGGSVPCCHKFCKVCGPTSYSGDKSSWLVSVSDIIQQHSWSQMRGDNAPANESKLAMNSSINQLHCNMSADWMVHDVSHVTWQSPRLHGRQVWYVWWLNLHQNLARINMLWAMPPTYTQRDQQSSPCPFLLNMEQSSIKVFVGGQACRMLEFNWIDSKRNSGPHRALGTAYARESLGNHESWYNRLPSKLWLIHGSYYSIFGRGWKTTHFNSHWVGNRRRSICIFGSVINNGGWSHPAELSIVSSLRSSPA